MEYWSRFSSDSQSVQLLEYWRSPVLLYSTEHHSDLWYVDNLYGNNEDDNDDSDYHIRALTMLTISMAIIRMTKQQSENAYDHHINDYMLIAGVDTDYGATEY